MAEHKVNVILSAIASERGTEKLFILLCEDPDTKILTLPAEPLSEEARPGEAIVGLAGRYIGAKTDWYSIYPSTFLKDNGEIYLLYCTRMTTNIRTQNNAGWFALESLHDYKGRIDPSQLQLVRLGINHSGITR
jgi:hypothetical protein